MIDSPELYNHIPDFPDKDDPEYNSRVSELKEFQIYGTPFRVDSTFLNTQKVVQLYMENNDRLLAFSDPGVGKTLTAIAVAESRHKWLKQSRGFHKNMTDNKALIIATGKYALNNTFLSDIITKTEGKYMTTALNTYVYADESRKQSAMTKSVSKSYSLLTYLKFANQLSKMNDDEITKLYSFRVIILDEIHILKAATISRVDGGIRFTSKNPSKPNGKLVFDQLSRLISLVKGCVIIGLTATPMVDDVKEFSSIINFITEPTLEGQVDPEEFNVIIKDIYNLDIDDYAKNLKDVESRLIEYLTPKIMGRISRVRISKSYSKMIYMTNESDKNVLYPLNNKLYLTRVDDSKTRIIEAYLHATRNKKTTKKSKSNFRIMERYVSNMIWPGDFYDGTQTVYGNDAFNEFLVKKENVYSLSEGFLEAFQQSVIRARENIITELEYGIRSLRPKDANRIKIEAQIKIYRERLETDYDPYIVQDMRAMLRAIRDEYSPKYATQIEIILGYEKLDGSYTIKDMLFDNQECCYVYNYYKKGGVISLGLMLELFGFKAYHSKQEDINDDKIKLDLTKPVKINGEWTDVMIRRYAVLAHKSEGDKGSTDSKIRTMMQIVNHPDNRYGQYIKVILGTSVSSQSINFTNIRQAHITPEWNISRIFQTEGRTDRASSHMAFYDKDDFPYETDIDPTGREIGFQMINGKISEKYVKIFRHAVLYDSEDLNGPKDSVEVQMYRDAFTKQIGIDIVSKIMEEIAFDSKLNNYRNYEQGRDLEYIGFSDNEKPTVVDNYNIFYAKHEMEVIRCEIKNIFLTKFSASLGEIIDILGKDTFHPWTVVKTLSEMVRNSESVYNRYGDINYIGEQDNIFFLQKNAKDDSDIMSYYSENMVVNQSFNISDAANKIQSNIAQDFLEQIGSGDIAIEDIPKVLKDLSLKSKSILVEYIIANRSAISEISEEAINVIFNELKTFAIYLADNDAVVHAFDIKASQAKVGGQRDKKKNIPSNRKGQLRIFKFSQGFWRNSFPVEDDLIIPIMNKFNITKPKFNLDYWGIRNGDKFMLDDRDSKESSSRTTARGTITKLTSSGRECSSMNKSWLINHLWNLPNIDITITIKIIRGGIVQVFHENEKYPYWTYGKIDKKKELVEIYVRQIRYTNLYPEILPLVYMEIIKKYDRSIFIDEYFYPMIDGVRYLVDILDDYMNILELLPKFIYDKLTKLINTSLKNIYDDIVLSEPEQDDIPINYQSPDEELVEIKWKTSTEMLIEPRFYRLWNSLTKPEMCALLYLVYFVNDSIS